MTHHDWLDLIRRYVRRYGEDAWLERMIRVSAR